MDETDIASVDSSSLLPRCTLKNSSKVRHAELGESIMDRTKTRKKGSESRRLKDDDAREGDCRGVDPAEKSLEEFESVDAYNRPPLPSNKAHASISTSKKYRFRVTRDARRLFWR